MLLSASLFSRQTHLQDYTKQLEQLGVNCLHIDYTQGVQAAIQPENLGCLDTSLPLDVHLIYEKLEIKDIDLFNRNGAKYLCVQYENLKNKKDLLLLNQFAGNKGIALLWETPVEEILKIGVNLDFILVMCSIPGVSGAPFDERNLIKIQEIKQRYPQFSVHVDGGIRPEKAKHLQMLGVSLCVCGSFLAMTEQSELVNRVCELRYLDSGVRVEKIMTGKQYLTITKAKESFCKLLNDMEESRVGTAFVEDEAGLFKGVITDGDIRRALMRYGSKCFDFSAGEITNKGAYTTTKDKQLKDILLERILLNKTVLIIPVLENGKVVGTVDLTKLL